MGGYRRLGKDCVCRSLKSEKHKHTDWEAGQGDQGKPSERPVGGRRGLGIKK